MTYSTETALPEQAANAQNSDILHAIETAETKLPHGLQVKDGRIYEGDHFICDYFEVLAETCDEHGRNHGRLIRVTSKAGQSHELTIPMKDLDAGYIKSTLRDHGLSIGTTHQKVDGLIKAYIQDMPSPRRIRCVTQSGWYDECYVAPHGKYPANDELVLQLDPRHHAGVREKGTLQEWQEYVALPCAGNSRFVLALSMAFAAPILSLVSDESGGVHFVGGTSCGKTTALRVAASVCGSPDYIRQWRATDNAMEGICQAYNHALLPLDELAQADSRKVDDMVYMMANGQSKARCTSDAVLRQTASWQMLCISTGELTIGDKISEGSKTVRGGVLNRLADIPADAEAGYGAFETVHGFTDGATLSNHLKDMSSRYYGTAIKAFMPCLAQKKKEMPSLFKTMEGHFFTDCNLAQADGQVKRVASRFALIALAGEFAIKCGVLPFNERDAYQAAITCFTAWVRQRGGIGAFEAEHAIATVRRFIESHQAGRFQTLGDADQTNQNERIHNLAGYKKANAEGGHDFLIQPETFRQEVCKGLDHAQVCKALVSKGMMIRNADRYTKQHKIDGVPLWFYTISPKILSEASSC